MEMPKNPKLWQVFTPIALAGALLYGGWKYAVNQSAGNNNLETRVVQEANAIEANEPNNLNYVVRENSVEENVAEANAVEENPNSNYKERDIDYKRLYEMIARHEGIRKEVYLDTKGIKTIGAGFNLEKAGAKERIEYFGLDYNDICSGKQKLSENEIYSLMEDDVETAISDAKNYVGENWNKLNPKAKEVIIDMSYNLGGPRINNFKKLKEALEKQDYKTAADEMKDSKWYSDVGNRSKELISIMKSIDK